MRPQLEAPLEPKHYRQGGGDKQQVIEVRMQKRPRKPRLELPAVESISGRGQNKQRIAPIPIPAHSKATRTNPAAAASSNFNIITIVLKSVDPAPYHTPRRNASWESGALALSRPLVSGGRDPFPTEFTLIGPKPGEAGASEVGTMKVVAYLTSSDLVSDSLSVMRLSGSARNKQSPRRWASKRLRTGLTG